MLCVSYGNTDNDAENFCSFTVIAWVKADAVLGALTIAWRLLYSLGVCFIRCNGCRSGAGFRADAGAVVSARRGLRLEGGAATSTPRTSTPRTSCDLDILRGGGV